MSAISKFSLAVSSVLVASLVACAAPMSEDVAAKSDSDLTAPRHCGGFAGLQCEADEYCAYAAGDMCGAADALGTCKKPAQICPEVYSPVCGCDGKTYGNSCDASRSGVSVQSNGACAPEPVFCPADYDPVCGTDGKTYSNACQAGAAGVEIASKGECKPEPKPTERSCGGWLGDTCSDKEYCAYVPGQSCGMADASATCRVRPEACTAEYDPVCGCDRKTYSNACVAGAAGTGVFRKGACN